MTLFRSRMTFEARIGRGTPTAASTQAVRGQRSVWVGSNFCLILFCNRAA